MHTFSKVRMSLQSVRLAHFLHTFFHEMQTLCIIVLLIICFHAHFLQNVYRLHAYQFCALQTFCRNCAHMEQNEEYVRSIAVARQAGARLPFLREQRSKETMP
jgi:hypothetical protein